MLWRILKRTLHRLAVLAGITTLALTAAASPASANTREGFGPFASSVDCGQSVYSSRYPVKAWACTWNTDDLIRTGIVVHNYGSSAAYSVKVKWERWGAMDGGPTTWGEATYGPVGMTVGPGATRVIYDETAWTVTPHGCGLNVCYYHGNKGWAEAYDSTGAASRTPLAYSPLQSTGSACVDGPLWDWPDTGRCD